MFIHSVRLHAGCVQGDTTIKTQTLGIASMHAMLHVTATPQPPTRIKSTHTQFQMAVHLEWVISQAVQVLLWVQQVQWRVFRAYTRY